MYELGNGSFHVFVCLHWLHTWELASGHDISFYRIVNHKNSCEIKDILSFQILLIALMTNPVADCKYDVCQLLPARNVDGIYQSLYVV